MTNTILKHRAPKNYADTVAAGGVGVTVLLDAVQREKLDALAAKYKSTRTEIIRMLIQKARL